MPLPPAIVLGPLPEPCQTGGAPAVRGRVERLVVVLLCAAAISTLASVAFGVHLLTRFQDEIGGYLERAAAASTPALAAADLDRALASIRRRGLDHGNVDPFSPTPDSELSAWYGNLCAARENLRAAGPGLDRNAAATLLLATRPALARRPEGIGLHPYQRPFAYWLCLSALFTVMFYALLVARPRFIVWLFRRSG